MSLKSMVAVGTLFCVLPAVAVAQSAQSASGTVNLNATVNPTCSLTDPVLNITALDFSKPSLASPSGVIDTSLKTATFPNSTCNVATHVALYSFNGGAIGGTYAAGASHQKFFDYLAVATFDTAIASLDTTGKAKGTQTATIVSAGKSSGPFTGNLTVDVTPFAPAHGLVAGSYADSIRVTLTAN